MRAVRCHALTGPSGLRVDEEPEPEPGPGEVLVDVRAAGVNFPDVLLSYGKYQIQAEPPFVPGGEAAGVVKAVGWGVTRCGVGDRVVAMVMYGAFAERIVAPELGVVKLPDAVSFELGAATLVTYATTWHALVDRARWPGGDAAGAGRRGRHGARRRPDRQAPRRAGDRGRVERREGRLLPRAGGGPWHPVHARGSEGSRQGADGRRRGERRLRSGRRPLRRAGAPRDRVGGPLPRGGLHRGRDPVVPAQPRATQGLPDRRRVPGVVRGARAGEEPRERGARPRRGRRGQAPPARRRGAARSRAPARRSRASSAAR